MEQMLRVPMLGLPFPQAPIGQPPTSSSTTIFPPTIQQQALFVRQYQQFFQQQQFNAFMQKLAELHAANKAPATVSSIKSV
jgi:hypothetical protein